MHTHIGHRRAIGRIHSGRLFGHRDYSGVTHALTGPALPYDGARYTALCGKSVEADYDGAPCNVRSETGIQFVTCRQCRKAAAKTP